MKWERMILKTWKSGGRFAFQKHITFDISRRPGNLVVIFYRIPQHLLCYQLGCQYQIIKDIA
jgi:hypothetical protein